MVIQFTIQELMFFLACALGIAAGILLIPILWNIKKMVGILQSLMETNQEVIKRTIRTMPGICEDIGQIGSNVRETTDKLKISVPVILQEVESVTNSAKGSIELAGVVMENMGSGINNALDAYKKDDYGFMTYVYIFEKVLQIIYRTFSSSK